LLSIANVWQFCRELTIFDQEYEDHAYQVGPFLTSQLLSSAPLNIAQAVVFAVIYWVMGGLRIGASGEHLVTAAVIMVGMQYHAVAMPLMCAAFSRSFAQASLICNSIFSFCGLLCGFFLNLDDLPVYVRWMSPLSFAAHGYRMFALTAFRDEKLRCPLPADDPLCAQFDGNRVLDSQSFADHSYVTPALGLTALIVGFFLLAYIALTFIPQPPTGTRSSHPHRRGRAVCLCPSLTRLCRLWPSRARSL
jgi:hypothetical protein